MSTKRIKTKCFYLNQHKRRVYRVMEENTAELFFLSKTQAALYVLKLQHRKMTNKRR